MFAHGHQLKNQIKMDIAKFVLFKDVRLARIQALMHALLA